MVFETKWDGFRLVTKKRGNRVRLWSRKGIDVTSRYAPLLPALQKIKGSCVIDGEICTLDTQGRSRFQLLQNALNKKAKLLYVVFDTLLVDGKDIWQKPLLGRKEILKRILPRDSLLRYSEPVAEFGKHEFAKAQRSHEEGAIAKRAAIQDRIRDLRRKGRERQGLESRSHIILHQLIEDVGLSSYCEKLQLIFVRADNGR